MSMLVESTESVNLDPGTFYFACDDSSRHSSDETMPLIVFQDGWHRIETSAPWASKREARLRFGTPYSQATKVIVALLVHAPPRTTIAECIVRIGDIETSLSKLTPRTSWHMAQGSVSQEGMLEIAILSEGRFGQLDPRNLYVGMRSLAYCDANDSQARAKFRRRTTSSLSRVYPIQAPAEPIAPELAPRPLETMLLAHREEVEVRQIGLVERTQWGMIRTLRGTSAIRGFCISRAPIQEIRILLDGDPIHVGPVKGGYNLKYEATRGSIRKYVFNVWYDFSNFPLGRYEIELRLVDVNRRVLSHRETILIAAPLTAAEHGDSDRVVSPPIGDPDKLEEGINSAPSMIRSGLRTTFERPPRNVLVLRTDQLGDMVCSVPAMRRLRQILPEARLVAMLSSANEGLARSLNLFDEILVVDFHDDPDLRRRVMSVGQQRELRAKLKEYQFDLAVDLSESVVSRPLLLLSGAPFLYGFQPAVFPWLSAGFEGITRDFANGLERVPHTDKVMGLVEWLGVLLKNHSQVVPRDDLKRDMLSAYGLKETDRYAVLHTGARIRFSRWPHYQKLADLILKGTDLRVVMMTDDPNERSKIAPALLNSERFQIIDRRVPFDDFDALLSFCQVFVGNDSGPKHLASLRGAKVVSIHMARNNWNEWGQENAGYIVSRRVPCAGCSIHHDEEECGKDFACVANISPDEVFGVVMRLVDDEQ